MDSVQFKLQYKSDTKSLNEVKKTIEDLKKDLKNINIEFGGIKGISDLLKSTKELAKQKEKIAQYERELLANQKKQGQQLKANNNTEKALQAQKINLQTQINNLAIKGYSDSVKFAKDLLSQNKLIDKVQRATLNDKIETDRQIYELNKRGLQATREGLSLTGQEASMNDRIKAQKEWFYRQEKKLDGVSDSRLRDIKATVQANKLLTREQRQQLINIQQMNSQQSQDQSGIVGSAIGLGLMSGRVKSLYSDLANIDGAFYNLGVVSGKTSYQIESMKDSFFDLGTEIPKVTKEMVESANTISRTGMGYRDAFLTMKSSSELASASGEDLAFTSELLAKQLVAFKLSGDDARETINSIHTVALQTPTSLQGVNDTLKSSASAFGALISFTKKSGEELRDYKQDLVDLNLAMTGSLAQIGLKASTSGIVIRNFMSRILSSEKNATKMFNNLSISFASATDDLSDYTTNYQKLSYLAKTDVYQALDVLKDNVDALTKSTVTGGNALQKMFTQRQWTPILSILNQMDSAGGAKAFVEGMTEGKKVSEDLKTQMKALNNQLVLFKNNFTKFEASATSSIKHASSLFLKVLNPAINVLNTGMNSAIGDMATFGLMLAGINIGLGNMFSIIKKINLVDNAVFSLKNPVILAIGTAIALATTLHAVYVRHKEEQLAIASIMSKTTEHSKEIEKNQKARLSNLNAIEKVNSAMLDNMSNATKRGLEINSIEKDRLDFLKEQLKTMDEMRKLPTDMENIFSLAVRTPTIISESYDEEKLRKDADLLLKLRDSYNVEKSETYKQAIEFEKNRTEYIKNLSQYGGIDSSDMVGLNTSDVKNQAEEFIKTFKDSINADGLIDKVSFSKQIDSVLEYADIDSKFGKKLTDMSKYLNEVSYSPLAVQQGGMEKQLKAFEKLITSAEGVEGISTAITNAQDTLEKYRKEREDQFKAEKERQQENLQLIQSYNNSIEKQIELIKYDEIKSKIALKEKITSFTELESIVSSVYDVSEINQFNDIFKDLSKTLGLNNDKLAKSEDLMSFFPQMAYWQNEMNNATKEIVKYEKRHGDVVNTTGKEYKINAENYKKLGEEEQSRINYAVKSYNGLMTLINKFFIVNNKQSKSTDTIITSKLKSMAITYESAQKAFEESSLRGTDLFSAKIKTLNTEISNLGESLKTSLSNFGISIGSDSIKDAKDKLKELKKYTDDIEKGKKDASGNLIFDDKASKSKYENSIKAEKELNKYIENRYKKESESLVLKGSQLEYIKSIKEESHEINRLNMNDLQLAKDNLNIATLNLKVLESQDSLDEKKIETAKVLKKKSEDAVELLERTRKLSEFNLSLDRNSIGEKDQVILAQKELLKLEEQKNDMSDKDKSDPLKVQEMDLKIAQSKYAVKVSEYSKEEQLLNLKYSSLKLDNSEMNNLILSKKYLEEKDTSLMSEIEKKQHAYDLDVAQLNIDEKRLQAQKQLATTVLTAGMDVLTGKATSVQSFNASSFVSSAQSLSQNKYKGVEGGQTASQQRNLDKVKLVTEGLNAGISIYSTAMQKSAEMEANNIKSQISALEMRRELAKTEAEQSQIDKAILTQKMQLVTSQANSQAEQAQAGGVSGALSGIATGAMMGGLAGAGVGGAMALTSIFTGASQSSSAKRQAEIQKELLKEQEETRKAVESQNKYNETSNEYLKTIASKSVTLGSESALDIATKQLIDQQGGFGGAGSVNWLERHWRGNKKGWEENTHTTTVDTSLASFGIDEAKMDTFDEVVEVREKIAKAVDKQRKKTDLLHNTMSKSTDYNEEVAGNQALLKSYEALYTQIDNLYEILSVIDLSTQKVYLGAELKELFDESGENIIGYTADWASMLEGTVKSASENAISQTADEMGTKFGTLFGEAVNTSASVTIFGKDVQDKLEESMDKIATSLEKASETGEYERYAGSALGILNSMESKQKELNAQTWKFNEAWVSVGGKISDIKSNLGSVGSSLYESLSSAMSVLDDSDRFTDIGSTIASYITDGIKESTLNTTLSTSLLGITSQVNDMINSGGYNVGNIYSLAQQAEKLTAMTQQSSAQISSISDLFSGEGVNYTTEASAIQYETASNATNIYNTYFQNQFDIGNMIGSEENLRTFAFTLKPILDDIAGDF